MAMGEKEEKVYENIFVPHPKLKRKKGQYLKLLKKVFATMWIQNLIQRFDQVDRTQNIFSRVGFRLNV